MYTKKCIVCKEEVYSLDGEYSYLYCRCSGCYQIWQDIQCAKVGVAGYKDKFYKDWVIDMNYFVVEEEHNGYCSDPGETEIVKSLETVTFPLLKQFERNENPTQHVINHYIEYEWLCGSGYCGMGSTLHFISARVRKK